MSDSYTFRAEHDDTYYAILVNAGENSVSASFEQKEEEYIIVGAIGAFSLIFLIIGIIIVLIGFIQKPKSVETLELNARARLIHSSC
jgi:hypothetical protein